MPAPSRCPVTSLSVAKDVVGAYARRGTLNNWKNTVGTLANDHRLLRFYTTAALAGALLHIGGFESGCFHLFGLSSMGKTTCLRMAASVWGSGADGGDVRTWRSLTGSRPLLPARTTPVSRSTKWDRPMGASWVKRCIWPLAASANSECAVMQV